MQVKDGDADRQIWLLEFGWTADTVHPDYAWFAVTEDKKAANIIKAFQYAQQNWSPWIGVMTLWTLADPTWKPDREEYWWAINNPDGTPRAALTAVKAGAPERLRSERSRSGGFRTLRCANLRLAGREASSCCACGVLRRSSARRRRPTPTSGRRATAVPSPTVRPSPVAAVPPRRRRRRRRRIGAAVAVPPRRQPRSQRQIPTTDPAVHVFLWGNAAHHRPRPPARAATAASTGSSSASSGATSKAKTRATSSGTSPTASSTPSRQTGLKIIARVDNQPQWASSSVQWPGSGPPDNPQDWTDFLTALATRYKGRIQAYEIWNEPNLDREWGDQQARPGRLRQHAQGQLSGHQGRRSRRRWSSRPACRRRRPTTPTPCPTSTSSRQMYAAGAKDSFDVLGVHAAGYKADPCADPAQVAQSPDLTNNDPEPDRPQTHLRVPPRRGRARPDGPARRRQQADGDRSRWAGRPTLGHGSQYAWFAVDRDQQAKNLVGAFQCARQNWQPWMGFMTVIYIPDPAWTQQQEQYWWSITNPDGSPRPAYTALKTFFATNP